MRTRFDTTENGFIIVGEKLDTRRFSLRISGTPTYLTIDVIGIVPENPETGRAAFVYQVASYFKTTPETGIAARVVKELVKSGWHPHPETPLVAEIGWDGSLVEVAF